MRATECTADTHLRLLGGTAQRPRRPRRVPRAAQRRNHAPVRGRPSAAEQPLWHGTGASCCGTSTHVGLAVARHGRTAALCLATQRWCHLGVHGRLTSVGRHGNERCCICCMFMGMLHIALGCCIGLQRCMLHIYRAVAAARLRMRRSKFAATCWRSLRSTSPP